jgi:hypothetical protein
MQDNKKAIKSYGVYLGLIFNKMDMPLGRKNLNFIMI